MTTHAPLTISVVARRAQVPLDTIRYYERRGLLPVPPRSSGGYRQFSPDAVRRVTFIKRAQALGFTLEEIAELLAFQPSPMVPMVRWSAGPGLPCVVSRPSSTS